jgi:hypothetical protein
VLSSLFTRISLLPARAKGRKAGWG